MIKKLWRIFSINIYEINFLLCFIGFSTYTTLMPESLSSILYRVVALTISLLCIFMKRRHIKIPKNKTLMVFLIIFTLLLFRTIYEVYFGELSTSRYEKTKQLIILFAIGVSYIPIMSVLFTYREINWKRTLTWFLILSLVVTAKGLFTINPDLLDSDGRFSLNSRQSTLVFGELAGTLIIISLSMLIRDFANSKQSYFMSILCVFGLVLGTMGIVKAGSRGPLVSTLFALLFIISIASKKVKWLFAIIILCLSFAGIMVLRELQEIAPVLYERMSSALVDGDTNGRSDHAIEALRLISENPLFGTNYILIDDKQYVSYHNCYLSVAVALGAIIGIIYTVLILKLLVVSFRNRRNIDNAAVLFLLALFYYFCIRSLTGIELLSDSKNALIVILTCIICKQLSKNNNRLFIV